MSGEPGFDAAEDVLPEHEALYEDDLPVSEARYQHELNRRMREQMELRAMCIENGEDAKAFLHSRFGQYILGQAELEADKARKAFESIDPENTKAIRELQNIIVRQQELEQWIDSAIEQGDAEYNEYLEEQRG